MSDLRKLLLNELSSPVIFDGLISDWSVSDWTPDYLADILGDQLIRCRLGKQSRQVVQWENQCRHEEITLGDLCDWLSNTDRQSGNRADYSRNRLDQKGFSPSKHWCYIDYKYMKDVFQGHPDILQAVKWETFGFPEFDGAQSTLWIGSKGAHTLCHKDTYGCNLVAQIYGRKRWVLFPPDNENSLYPTRIPYEESSVFSQVNIQCPDFSKHPLFQQTDPYVVNLEPGQVLFVPRHWWHYVESLSTSISINCWVDMPEFDDKERLKEAVTRAAVFALMAEHGSWDDWLNPTEDPNTHEENMALLNQALHSIGNQRDTIGRDVIEQSVSVEENVSAGPNVSKVISDTVLAWHVTAYENKKLDASLGGDRDRAHIPLIPHTHNSCEETTKKTGIDKEFLEELITGTSQKLNNGNHDSENGKRICENHQEDDRTITWSCKGSSDLKNKNNLMSLTSKVHCGQVSEIPIPERCTSDSLFSLTDTVSIDHEINRGQMQLINYQDLRVSGSGNVIENNKRKFSSFTEADTHSQHSVMEVNKKLKILDVGNVSTKCNRDNIDRCEVLSCSDDEFSLSCSASNLIDSACQTLPINLSTLSESQKSSSKADKHAILFSTGECFESPAKKCSNHEHYIQSYTDTSSADVTPQTSTISSESSKQDTLSSGASDSTTPSSHTSTIASLSSETSSTSESSTQTSVTLGSSSQITCTSTSSSPLFSYVKELSFMKFINMMGISSPNSVPELSKSTDHHSTEQANVVTTTDLINCFTHSRVVSLVSELLLNKLSDK